MPAQTPDILILGGGVIGLTTALMLADHGVSVTVIDRQACGQEASWAGAGMLPPGNPAGAKTPEARLRSYSHSLWPDFAAGLFQRTGIDSGYHVCGAIDLLPDASFPDASAPEASQSPAAINPWLTEGIAHQNIANPQLERFVADLNPRFRQATFLPDFAQIRNPRHLRSLKAACLQRGVEIFEHADNTHLLVHGNRVTEVRTSSRRFQFDQICLAAGAWTGHVLQSLGMMVQIKPVRGQIVQLQLPVQPFRCIIELGRRYLVPRRDGLILIGSTEEDAGFVKQNTTEGVAGLLEFAKMLIPPLAQAEVVRSWAGLRPGSPDELPLLGQVPNFSNAFVGAGHFRSGIQMSPGTGNILADLMLGKTPQISLAGYEPDRFAQTNGFELNQI